MAQEAPRLTEGFTPDNVWRIYHGRKALINGWDAQGVLPRRVFEATTYFADGLAPDEVAEAMQLPDADMNGYLHEARKRLGITTDYQLAGFFPMSPDYGAVQEKKLGDFTGDPQTLRVLELMSVGKPVAESDLQPHMEVVEGVWSDIEGGIMAVRVANALRGRYIQAIEAQPGAIPEEGITRLSLPVLAVLEPRIETEFLNPDSPA